MDLKPRVREPSRRADRRPLRRQEPGGMAEDGVGLHGSFQSRGRPTIEKLACSGRGSVCRNLLPAQWPRWERDVREQFLMMSDLNRVNRRWQRAGSERARGRGTNRGVEQRAES
jgi:hypothetical protein